MVLLSYIIFFVMATIGLANVEKTIFLAPEPVARPDDAAIDNLLLHSLHTRRTSIRTHIAASFPTDSAPHGQDTWVLLGGLTPGQRYEVRVCWLATQPTTYWIDTYGISETFETPELISSLSAYSYNRRRDLSDIELSQITTKGYRSEADTLTSSILFLRIQAAADYFSLNKTLMEKVPPVHVDMILDPFLMNVFPQSLVPTAAYIVIIAIFSIFIANFACQKLRAIANSTEDRTRKTSMKTKKDE